MVSHNHEGDERCPHCRIRKFLLAVRAVVDDAHSLAEQDISTGLLDAGFVDAAGERHIVLALDLARVSLFSAGHLIENALGLYAESSGEKGDD